MQNSKIVIALGCVIKGETDHYHYICDAVSNGVMRLTLESDIPILFGVLTCQNAELAYARSSNNKKNKGYELGNAVKMMLENT
jgi:6,7-dimethyl-8-ribityllumazine synthase